MPMRSGTSSPPGDNPFFPPLSAKIPADRDFFLFVLDVYNLFKKKKKNTRFFVQNSEYSLTQRVPYRIMKPSHAQKKEKER